jgi:hypothetical protein
LKNKTVILLMLVVLSSVFGCAPVKPWEREHLADPIMLPDYNKEEKAVREHSISTREGSAGSFGVSGGGCGCN